MITGRADLDQNCGKRYVDSDLETNDTVGVLKQNKNKVNTVAIRDNYKETDTKKKLTTLWKTDIEAPITKGINNLSNTCYLNAVIQVLLNNPLVHYTLKNGVVPDTKKKPKLDIDNIIKSLGKESRTTTMTPSYLVDNLHQLDKRFIRGKQQDAHEFYLLMINNMCNQVANQFKGKLKSQVICTKGHISETEEEFLNLSLCIDKNKSIDSSLRAFFQPSEKIKGYKCDECKKETTIVKKYVPYLNPDILVLQISRFDISGRKIQKHVPFEYELKFNSNEYDLYATVEHLGSTIDFGHYIANVCGANGSWYRVR